jgi:hypothetical protein
LVNTKLQDTEDTEEAATGAETVAEDGSFAGTLVFE